MVKMLVKCEITNLKITRSVAAGELLHKVTALLHLV